MSRAGTASSIRSLHPDRRGWRKRRGSTCMQASPCARSTKACDRGYAPSGFNLGVLLLRSRSIRKDKAGAAAAFASRCALGDKRILRHGAEEVVPWATPGSPGATETRGTALVFFHAPHWLPAFRAARTLTARRLAIGNLGVVLGGSVLASADEIGKGTLTPISTIDGSKRALRLTAGATAQRARLRDAVDRDAKPPSRGTSHLSPRCRWPASSGLDRRRRW